MGVSSCPELGRPQDPSTRRGGPCCFADPLPPETLEAVTAVYDELIRPAVHDKW